MKFVQSILETLGTDEIHMEDWNHGLAWTKPTIGIYNMENNFNRLMRKQLH